MPENISGGCPAKKILNVKIILVNYCNYVKNNIIANRKIISRNKRRTYYSGVNRSCKKRFPDMPDSRISEIHLKLFTYQALKALLLFYSEVFAGSSATDLIPTRQCLPVVFSRHLRH